MRVLERVRVWFGGHLHRRGGHHLHQVVDHDVAQRADGVVEVTAVLDAEALGHRDLHGGEVVAAPDRLERRVGEAQVEDLRRAHLPEEVVDPVQLGLVDVAVHLRGQLARGLQVVAEGLLDDHPRAVGQAGVGQALDDAAEQERRDLEVEHRRLRVVDRRGHPLEGRGVARSRPRRRRSAPRSGRRRPSSIGSPVASIDVRARSRRSSTVQSSTATPTIGQSSSPRRSSRYSDRKVICLARSPVIPNTTSTSAGRASAPAEALVVVRACGLTAVLMGLPCARWSSWQACSPGPRGPSSPDASETAACACVSACARRARAGARRAGACARSSPARVP